MRSPRTRLPRAAEPSALDVRRPTGCPICRRSGGPGEPPGMNDSRRLQERLVELIPQRVGALGIVEPVYCLRVWYYGTDAGGDRVPSLMLCPDAARRRVLAEKGDAAPHYLWCADEVGAGAYTAEINDPTVSDLCRLWYRRPGVAGRRKSNCGPSGRWSSGCRPA